MMKYAVLAVLALAATTSAVELDGATFEDAIAGKSALVKFLAPW
jgi:hypothetical protein